MRSSAAQSDPDDGETSPTPVRSIAATVQQYKTRRRRGSLRKVALLGRRAQSDRRDGRDSRDGRPLAVDAGRVVEELVHKLAPKTEAPTSGPNATAAVTVSANTNSTMDTTTEPTTATLGLDTLGVGTAQLGLRGRHGEEIIQAESHVYSSTTDEEDLVQIDSRSATPSRSGLSLSLSSESFYGSHGSPGQRHRVFQRAKSPLSFSGISTTAVLPPTDPDWDYSETEWWGWVVLTVTWFVFVVGMGSCLDVWSWAWDVGTTPYAPPELEDDPTLPIVGYYPALIILTCVMAWVWVVVAWVGMKYFRHAKISGD